MRGGRRVKRVLPEMDSVDRVLLLLFGSGGSGRTEIFMEPERVVKALLVLWM